MIVRNDDSAPIRLLGYLPLVVLTTASVVVLPAVLVAAFVPRGNSLLMVASTASAVAVSVAIASAEAALWTRLSGSRDLVFAELMLWGWLRRCWTERRLARARALYDSARKVGPAVSIELLEDLSKRLEARDAYTHGHSRRVARHAERIARAMQLSVTEIAKIHTAATVHDVGKIYTPREILNNPGRLTDREYAIVKLHAGDGADTSANGGTGTHELVAVAAGPAAPPTNSSSAPEPPAATPAPPAPPVEKAPIPPTSPPVTLPSVPNLPAASVPGVSVSTPGISVSVPGVSVSVPSISISTTEALDSKTR